MRNLSFVYIILYGDATDSVMSAMEHTHTCALLDRITYVCRPPVEKWCKKVYQVYGVVSGIILGETLDVRAYLYLKIGRELAHKR